MNPTTSNTCGDITPLFTRRDVLGNLACGFGWLAFAGLADGMQSQPMQIARAETAALPGAGEARDFSLHEGRAVACGHV